MKSKTGLTLNIDKLPSHIAFIMDGNGRWAKKKLLPRKAGHKQGVETLKSIVKSVFSLGIPYISVYAFSTENQFRPEDEKSALFSLIKEYFENSLDYFIENEINIRYMGDISYFSQDIIDVINTAVKKSEKFKAKTLNIALNYGAQDEIVRAANLAVEQKQPVTKESFEKLLYTNGMPAPDLIVRTSGECRLSNFMMYQAAYSELIFIDTLWPDFNVKKLYEVLEEYSQRNRRFGKVEKT